MPVNIVRFATKAILPRQRPEVLRRQRLIDFLLEHLHKRVQLISAPAGYGKTTLLVDLTSELDCPVCWYALDPSDQDPRVFLDGLTESIRSRFPSFGEDTRSRLRLAGDMAREAPYIIACLAGEIYRDIPEYFVIVLEDYHFSEESPLTRDLLCLLLEHIPDNCHIIISSRTPLDLPIISKLSVRGEAVELDSSALAFTTTETKELLTSRMHLPVSESEASKLTSDSEGWILGILLGTQQLSKKPLAPAAPGLTREHIFRYLASEVYQRQPLHIKTFLLSSSILRELQAEFCDQLLGVTNSQQLLEEIEKRSLFISRLESERILYRYHALFREFLEARLRLERPHALPILHHKAACLFEQEKNWDDAISHYTAANEHEQVVRVIKQAGEEFLKAGKWQTVSNWLQAVPDRIRASEPFLMLLEAESLIHLGQIDASARILNQLVPKLLPEQDWLTLARALSWRSAAFRLSGFFHEAIVDIEQCIHILRQRGGLTDILADAYRRLGNIYGEQGRLFQAKKHLLAALRLYRSTFDVDETAAVNNSLGAVYKRLGDLVKANTHYEQAMQGWQKVKNLGALAGTLNNMAVVYHLQGQYELALDTLKIALERARETGYRPLEACILNSIGDVKRDLDLFDDALAAYNEGLQVAREVMEPRLVAYAVAGIGETHRLLGDLDKAEVLLKEAASQAEEHGQTYESCVFMMQLGVIAYERGQFETSKAFLLRVCGVLEKLGDKHVLSKGYFHLAQLSFLSRRYLEAVDWLQKVCWLVDQLGYDEVLVAEGKRAPLLIQYAVSKGIDEGRFIRIRDRIRAHVSKTQQAVGSGTLPKPPVGFVVRLEAHAFGQARVLLNSGLVATAAWQTVSAYEMFFYFLCNRTRVTKEQVFAALWTDISPTKASSKFHINLYRIRRATFPGVIALENDRYSLCPDLDIWFDAAIFESCLKQADNEPSVSTTKLECLERALQLYQGPFLEDFYSEWSQTERRRFEEKYLNTLFRLATYYRSSRQYNRAIDLLKSAIAVNAYYDEAYYELIQCCLSAGDSVSALAVYQQYYDVLTWELASEPTPQMKELYQQIVSRKAKRARD